MNKYVSAVLGAGFCWGFMGFFTRQLAAFGINSNEAIIVRCSVAAVCFGLLILFRDPVQFRIRIKDLWCFLGSGLLSLLFFTFCYFHAISMMSLSAAAILLYTAPAIVTLLSAVLFREKITKTKIAAVLIAFAGCCLVSGIGTDTVLTLQGILYGLGAGFGYALYTIFSRYALQRGYSSSTITNGASRMRERLSRLGMLNEREPMKRTSPPDESERCGSRPAKSVYYLTDSR